MDFNNQPSDNQSGFPNGNDFSRRSIQPNTMAIVSMGFAIAGVIATLFVPFFLPCFFGSIAIVFALLSKGSLPRMHTQAKIALVASICSIIINVFILCASIYAIIYIPEFHDEFSKTYESIYGESFDDALEHLQSGKGGVLWQ